MHILSYCFITVKKSSYFEKIKKQFDNIACVCVSAHHDLATLSVAAGKKKLFSKF